MLLASQAEVLEFRVWHLIREQSFETITLNPKPYKPYKP